MNRISLVVLLGIIVLFSSCGDSSSSTIDNVPQEKDTSPHIANMLPLNNQIYKRGGLLVVSADITDKEGLAWYEIEVNILDGTSIPSGTTPFSFVEQNSIENTKSASIEKTITLRNNVLDGIITIGSYKVKLTVADIAGNTTVEERTISIEKRLDLVISDLIPQDNGTIYIGDPIFLKTNVQSEKLSYYEIDIHNNFNNHSHSKNTRIVVEEKPFYFNKKEEIQNVTDITEIADVIDVTLFIGENNNPVQEGMYHLIFTVTDVDGDKKSETRNIRLVNK